MSTSISRGTFLKGLGALAAAGLCGEALLQLMKQSQTKFPCRMLGPSRALGHLLRNPETLSKIPVNQSHKEKRKVTIVGGGVAGLSAAWWLKKHGITDFILLELEKEVGGNAVSGKNQFGAYPWGAHYIPIPNKESVYVRLLLEELNILRHYNEKGEPIYDELMLCHEPQERLYKDGAFHEGLVPKRGLQKYELDDIARFFGMVVDFRQAIGKDAKPAFAIPLDLSSQDPKYTVLDKISMSQWLEDNNFQSKPILWYINYCCRDDYGSTADNVSAWAGIHYFAGRRGTAGNAEQNAVLTWPQGNGYLVERLRQGLKDYIHVSALVSQIASKEQEGGIIEILFTDGKGNQGIVESEHVIFAAPRFIANHVIKDGSYLADAKAAPKYAPWMVANISLSKLPETRGTAPAWDNVSYYSDSLGYVMADHQEITTRQKPMVITYYYPMSQNHPRESRQALYRATTEEWKEIIVKDLEHMHAGIENQIISIDLWPWGHGMVRPDVGYIWGEERKQMKNNAGNIVFAHSDMSGISNFEEAQHHGIEAAKVVMAKTS